MTTVSEALRTPVVRPVKVNGNRSHLYTYATPLLGGFPKEGERALCGRTFKGLNWAGRKSWDNGVWGEISTPSLVEQTLRLYRTHETDLCLLCCKVWGEQNPEALNDARDSAQKRAW